MSVVFLLFWITCGVFAADVLLGKIGILTGGAVHSFSGDVSHFLLLALAAALPTAECLRWEARRNGARRSAAQAASDSQATSN